MTFNQRAIRLGIVTLSAGIIANFVPATYLFVAYGIMPPLSDLFKIWTLAVITFGVSWFVQPITFFSMFGPAGTYIGWLTGNCADLRAPAVTMAQKAAGYESGTPEGDVLATIGITCSTFVSVSMITVFTFAGAQLLDLLPPFVTGAFKYILPAVFGAVNVQLWSKHVDIGIKTMVCSVVLALLFKSLHVPGWLLNLACIGVGIGFARMKYKKSKAA